MAKENQVKPSKIDTNYSRSALLY